MSPHRTKNPGSSSHHLWIAISVLAVSACDISPQPVPPPEEREIRVDVNLISIEPAPEPESVVIVGQPGAATPGSEAVEVSNLDTPGIVGGGPVASDGGFILTLPGTFDTTFRVQANLRDIYSMPVDVRGGGVAGPVKETLTPFDGCLIVRSPRELAFPPTPVGGVKVEPIEMFNQCSFDIMVTGQMLTYGNASFVAFDGAPAGYIAMGQRWLAGVAFAPNEQGLQRDLLQIALEQVPNPVPEPVTSQYWYVSLRGVAGPPEP